MNFIYFNSVSLAIFCACTVFCQEPAGLDTVEATAQLRELADKDSFDSFQDYYRYREFLHEISALELDIEPSLLIEIARKFSGTRSKYLSFDALFAYRSCVGDEEFLLGNFRKQSEDLDLAVFSLIVLSYDVDEDLVVKIERIGNPSGSSRITWAIEILKSTHEAKLRLSKREDTSDRVYYLCRLIWLGWGRVPFDIYWRLRPTSVWAREEFLKLCAESPEAVAKTIAEKPEVFAKRTGIEDVEFVKALCSEDVRKMIESYD